MIPTTNMPPLEGYTLLAADVVDFIRAIEPHDKAEIQVGSVEAFAAWCDREIGPLKKVEAVAPACFSGIPVIAHPNIPSNTVVLVVNGEIENIVVFDPPNP